MQHPWGSKFLFLLIESLLNLLFEQLFQLFALDGVLINRRIIRPQGKLGGKVLIKSLPVPLL